VAVCLSGTVRTFAAAAVRDRFVDAMLSLARAPSRGGGQAGAGARRRRPSRGQGGRVAGGNGCDVEIFAHVPVAAPPAPWSAHSWADDGAGLGEPRFAMERSDS
jgi:hypothetical protein